MNVAVNGRFLSRRVTGVERYAREVLKRIADQPRLVCASGWAHGMGGQVWDQVVLPAHLYSDELLWSPANIGPLAVSRQVLTLHDLTPLEHPEWFVPVFSLWYRFLLPLLIRRVRRVVVSSSYMCRKVSDRFGLPRGFVSVVPGGVDLERFKPDVPLSRELPERYVLFVGSIQPRKNLPVLFEAWERIHTRYPDVWLVVAGASGPVFARQQIQSGIEQVIWLGYAPEDRLPALYCGAQVFVMPSKEEGFGLPVLEAMACGAPVIAASEGALPEVAGGAANLFNPACPNALVEALDRLLSDSTLRFQFAEKGLRRAREFGWERPAAEMLKVWQECY